MKIDALDLTDCDREPIHVPGSIQPHGLMLVADRDNLIVSHGAGPIETLLSVDDWQGRALGDLVGDDIAARVARLVESSGVGGFAGQTPGPDGRLFDVHTHVVAEHVIVEIEPGPVVAATSSAILGGLEAAALAFERMPNLRALCERAAVEFRRLTGFDRVMIYRFLDDEAGAVLAEDRDPAMPSFLNHHFPGSDIPRQARALYLRNLVRVIPDVRYQPAPLRPAWPGQPLDMSDSALRSVSPIHMQYMQNMGVGASASVSIVKDGVLWGLIACHHATPRLLPYDVRIACRALAGGLSRQIKAKEEAEAYRERIRLRSFEDEATSLLSRSASLDDAVRDCLPPLGKMLDADGVAALRGGEVVSSGICPPESAIRELAAWMLAKWPNEAFETDRLSEIFEPAASYAEIGSGLLSVVVSADEPFVLLWFRAERVQEVNWAGNPHKAVTADGALNPRSSFEAWSQSVYRRSRPWSMAAPDAACRLRDAMLAARQGRRLRELNQRLSESVAEKDALIQQKEMLLHEVNHRVQNSLQLVSSFLGLQARASEDEALKENFEEARRRLTAVALVHRRLYRADQIETVDLARYMEELVDDLQQSLGPEWAGMFSLQLAPVVVPTDRAVTLGLVLTELVINANKYAYGGRPGPVEVTLSKLDTRMRLIVADKGRGRQGHTQGFGSRMMNAMVSQLQGELVYEDNEPGLRAVLLASIAF
jgi:chemotaxis family two-component system sensor kinase Cph1